MKKLLLTLMLSLVAVVFSGCDEEDAGLMFTTVSISDPENVKIEYFSPDPCCVGKMYWIAANAEQSELTLKCTTSSSIAIGSSSATYTSPSGHWSARVVDNRTVTITFDAIETASDDSTDIDVDVLRLVGQAKDGQVRTDINVRRVKTKAPIMNAPVF